MRRRTFVKAVTAVIPSFPAAGKSRAATGPNLTGWKITWNELPDSPTSAGYWLALPTSGDRNTAFKSLVSKLCTGPAKSAPVHFERGTSGPFAMPQQFTLVPCSSKQLAEAKKAGRTRIERMITASKNATGPIPGVFGYREWEQRPATLPSPPSEESV